MDQEFELEDSNGTSFPPEAGTGNDPLSMDDFIKQLEEKEKDLHITADTSIIEIAEGFEDGSIPEELMQALSSSKGNSISDSKTGPTEMEASSLREKVAELNAVIAKMEADQAEMFKNSQRRAKDHDAFKARMERERRDTFQNQISNLATLMLPALDNLQRALESAESIPESKNGNFGNFYDGIALVSEQITDILGKMGIRRILTVGEEFDPHYHEAVSTEETDEFPPNTVCGELLTGFIAGDKVIRHSLVKVAKPIPGSQSPVEETEPPQPSVLEDEDDTTLPPV